LEERCTTLGAPVDLNGDPIIRFVTKTWDEYEVEKQAEFKAGLQYGLWVAVKKLAKWGTGKFIDKKDLEAQALRYASELLEEERQAQKYVNYNVRPHGES
jgi:hypothetical protein